MDNYKEEMEDKEIMSVGQIEIDASRFTKDPDTESLPILPTRNLVLFPGVTIPISLGRASSREVAEMASTEAVPVGIVCQVNPEEENPAVTTGLYHYGVVADVLNIFKLPDGSQTALVRARGKFRILGKGKPSEKGDFLSARVKLIDDMPAADEDEFKIVTEQILKLIHSIIERSGDNPGFEQNLQQLPLGAPVVNFVATNMPCDAREKSAMLAKSRISDRAFAVLAELTTIDEKMTITHDIMSKAKRSMENNQRSAFLQQQMESIREELYGDSDDEIEMLEKRAEKISFPTKVRETFAREVDKLRRYNPQSPDYAVQYSYLDTLLSLPWNVYPSTNEDLGEATKILEEDHYGLEKVKERVLEQLAVLMHNPSGKAPIICLVGAPGVGKTSIGKSVARALGRKYSRVSLGGLHDEAEIRGHRRTYIGAMPGRIIDAMKRAEVSNPVLLLDEIDKIGADFKGDPAAALLEVLDPEQNCRFHDNYIDVDYDLSHVLFIATANTLSTLARPLLDRMEIIDISGYLQEEKIEIARRHLIPRVRTEHKLTEEEFDVSDEALACIIRRYTSESGVRQLEKKIAALARKSVLYKMQGREFPTPVMPDNLYDLLGLAPRIEDEYEGNEFAGVVTGLAWTEVGGEILMAESSLSPSKDGRLTITGNLGDVMKESATIALQWVKAHAAQLGIDSSVFNRYGLHIHFPEGAIPKDGPSAGITIATSIVSTLTQKRVAERIAMTGEITLRGKVLPVGGIKEKILAAKRAGIKTIILSEKNRKDIEDIPAKYLEGLDFVYVDTVMDVMRRAITDEPVVDPIDLSAPAENVDENKK